MKNAKELALLAARALSDKKGKEIREHIPISNVFTIAQS